MSTHTSCLAEACGRLGVPHSFLAGDKNILQIDLGRRYYFVSNAAPFNDEAVAKICRDKEFTYKLLKGLMAVPRTMGFVDPQGPEIYRDYARLSSYEEIAAAICSSFDFPVIVKRNSGSRGQNVFLCHDRQTVGEAISAVFQKEPRGYDHVLLAQEYLPAQEEYRVIVFRKEVLLAYRKDNSGATFTGNLSPLHWENSNAALITDPAALERFRTFTLPIYDRLDLEYGGLDIIKDGAGELRLVEINSRPGFSYFVRDNGREPLIGMYEKILTALRAA